MKEFVPAGKYRVLKRMPLRAVVEGYRPSHRGGSTWVQLWSCAYPRQLKKWLADNSPPAGVRYMVATVKIVELE